MRWRNVPLPEGHLAAIAVGMVLRWMAPGPRRPRRGARLLGWMLLAAGGLLAAQAVADMGELDSAAPTRLVTRGAFARSRNPMYLAWTLIQAGIGLLTDAAGVLGLLPLVVWYTDRVVIPQEEQQLTAAFGEAYRRYQARVPRYL